MVSNTNVVTYFVQVPKLCSSWSI